MLIKLINWFRGILFVRIRGIAPERFINLCCNKKIYIWDLRRIEEDYQFKISAKNYKKLKPIAKKTGMLPRITKKIGFPFLKHRYRKRKGFFAGILICTIIIYTFSLYIWNISILGGLKYTPEAMIKFLKENHVYTGIQKKKVRCQEIEETIRLAYPDIGWVSAEIKGTRLIIKITETNMPAPAAKAIAPSHIVATKDLIVKNIITRKGTPLVKEGDVVKKGDILVSGIVNIMGDFEEIINKEIVVADADIVCTTFYDYKETFPMNYQERIYSKNREKGYFITFFEKKLFLYNPSNSYLMYDIIVNENTLHIAPSFYLPIRYGTITTREYTEEKRTYAEEEAIAIANARLKRYLDRLIEKKVIITENNVKITVDNNRCTAQGRILVEEPAWEYKIIQENEWRIEQTDEHSGNND